MLMNTGSYTVPLSSRSEKWYDCHTDIRSNLVDILWLLTGRCKQPAEVKLPEGDLKSLDIAYSETRRVFDVQLEQIDKLDAKTGLLLGAAGVVLALLVQGDLGETSQPSAGLVLAGAIIIGASAVLSLFALWVRTFTVVPEPRVLCAAPHITDEPDSTKREMLKGLVRYYEMDRCKAAGKAFYANAAAVFLVLGLGCVIAAFATTVL